jgi:hypothetical protein
VRNNILANVLNSTRAQRGSWHAVACTALGSLRSGREVQPAHGPSLPPLNVGAESGGFKSDLRRCIGTRMATSEALRSILPATRTLAAVVCDVVQTRERRCRMGGVER